MNRLKAAKRREPKAKVSNPLALSPWHKRCPRCRAELHIRKSTCDCGHKFETMLRSLSDDHSGHAPDQFVIFRDSLCCRNATPGSKTLALAKGCEPRDGSKRRFP